MSTWVCHFCGHRYDESKGEPALGIPPGTALKDLPEDFECPNCGAAKGDFRLEAA